MSRVVAEGVEVRFAGMIERGKNYRWVEGYSVVVDGRPTYPWQGKREALRLAKSIARERDLAHE
jgi:hypothetical protein